MIGANSVVTHSVPPRAAALGAPALMRPAVASFDMVVYRGSAQDEDRQRSQELLGGERVVHAEQAAKA